MSRLAVDHRLNPSFAPINNLISPLTTHIRQPQAESSPHMIDWLARGLQISNRFKLAAPFGTHETKKYSFNYKNRTLILHVWQRVTNESAHIREIEVSATEAEWQRALPWDYEVESPSPAAKKISEWRRRGGYMTYCRCAGAIETLGSNCTS